MPIASFQEFPMLNKQGKPVISSHTGKPLMDTLLPTVEQVEKSPNEYIILYAGKAIGRLKQNIWGLWPVETGVGFRYYSNPLCASYDYYLARNITADEAAFVVPPPKPSYYQRKGVHSQLQAEQDAA